MDEKIDDGFTIENAEIDTKDDLILSTESATENTSTKDEKGRKKNPKRAAEQYLKRLHDVHTTEEKLAALSKKYSEVIDENRKLQLTVKQAEKKILMLLREKEQYQGERTKAVLTRKKLESLCRELQKQNKAVKEESLLQIQKEEEKRKEVSEKLQDTLDEIKAAMNQNIEKSTKVYEENVKLNMKCRDVYAHIEQQEQQMQKLRQTHEEIEILKLVAHEEKEALLKDQQQLLFQLSAYEKQIRDLQSTEVGLRSQISMYTDKYDEFQNTLNRSNKVYGEFNEEIERMSKKILTLEKETGVWKQRWEKSHVALLDMASDKQAKDEALLNLGKKVSLLQDLCKMFQRERTRLLAQLKENTGMSESEIIARTNAEINESSKSATEATNDNSTSQDSTLRGLQMGVVKVSEVTQDEAYTDIIANKKDVAQKTDGTTLESNAAIMDEKVCQKLKAKIEDANRHNEEIKPSANNVTKPHVEAVHIECNGESIKNEPTETREAQCSATSTPNEIEHFKETEKSEDTHCPKDDSQVERTEVLNVCNRLEELETTVKEAAVEDVAEEKSSLENGQISQLNEQLLIGSEVDETSTLIKSIDIPTESSSEGPIEANAVLTAETNSTVKVESPEPLKVKSEEHSSEDV